MDHGFFPDFFPDLHEQNQGMLQVQAILIPRIRSSIGLQFLESTMTALNMKSSFNVSSLNFFLLRIKSPSCAEEFYIISIYFIIILVKSLLNKSIERSFFLDTGDKKTIETKGMSPFA